MRWLSMFVVGTLLVCCQANTVQAQVQTFDVDLSGIAGNSGLELKVFGTITLDPTQPVDHATILSALFIQHDTDPATALPPVPVAGNANPQASNLQWNLIGSDLYINRISNVNSGLLWTIGTLNGEERFQLGSGANVEHSASIDSFGIATFKSSSGPDGPMGFLVGTAAVPEPTSAIFLAGIGAAFSLRRRR